jgi:predicted transcriptional regulator
MANFTSSLPDSILVQLREMALKLNVPKNQIIQRALVKYLAELERQMYIRSFINLSGDEDFLEISEEGMEDYHRVLDEWDEKR